MPLRTYIAASLTTSSLAVTLLQSPVGPQDKGIRPFGASDDICVYQRYGKYVPGKDRMWDLWMWNCKDITHKNKKKKKKYQWDYDAVTGQIKSKASILDNKDNPLCWHIHKPDTEWKQRLKIKLCAAGDDKQIFTMLEGRIFLDAYRQSCVGYEVDAETGKIPAGGTAMVVSRCYPNSFAQLDTQQFYDQGYADGMNSVTTATPEEEQACGDGMQYLPSKYKCCEYEGVNYLLSVDQDCIGSETTAAPTTTVSTTATTESTASTTTSTTTEPAITTTTTATTSATAESTTSTTPESTTTETSTTTSTTTEPTTPNQACLDAAAESAPYYVDGNSGNDAFPGTTDCPKKTIQAAVDLIQKWKRDEVIIREGHYRETVTILSKGWGQVKAAPGHKVVIDGSADVKTDLGGVWTEHSTHENGNKIYSINTGVDAWQLFVNGKEQIPARWPNANFEDGSVFNVSHHWAVGSIDLYKTWNSGVWTYPYGDGILMDAGGISGGFQGDNTHPALNESGIDPVGAIAVLNIGSWQTWSRRVNTYDLGTNSFTYDTVPGWFGRHHVYFLEGKLELIDEPGEWFFNPDTKTIYYMSPAGTHPDELNIRVKTTAYSLICQQSADFVLEGITFFASTFHLDRCYGAAARDLTLLYPSTSKRSLGIAGEDHGPGDRWLTRVSGGKVVVERCSFLYTDGPAFEMTGGGEMNLTNNYFYHIDWSGSDQYGVDQSVFLQGSANEFSYNTVRTAGASQTIVAGHAAMIKYNHLSDVLKLQSDRSAIHIMPPSSPDTVVSHNWVHDSPGWGIRMDDDGKGGSGRNTTLENNVIWNTSGGIAIKGDRHYIYNNTVFGTDPPDWLHFTSDPMQNIAHIPQGDTEGENMEVSGNAVDRMAYHRTQTVEDHPLPGHISNNFNGWVDEGGSVESQLIDPAGFNFCPKPDSAIAAMGVGAYAVDCNDPWVPGIDWDFVMPDMPDFTTN